MNFANKLLFEILDNLTNDYPDNFDNFLFKEKKIVENKIKRYFKRILNKKGFFNVKYEVSGYKNQFLALSNYNTGLSFLYGLLSDSASQDLLITLIAYRIMGYKKIKLPVNNKFYWEKIKELRNLEKKNDFIETGFRDRKLFKMNLISINYPIELYFSASGVMTDFVLKQYEYDSNGVIIKPLKDDYVLDCGACWGDTALYFANEVGKNGRVFSFEFIESNYNIFNKNIELNSEIKERIRLTKNPVWDTSNVKMFCADAGPGSRVSIEEPDIYDKIIETITIDDFVASNKIKKIDFIKMDIEGAEPYALRGAEKTIKKFKPKLAIAIYHSMDDFINIPKQINNLNQGYKFFLGHYTIHTHETILYAIAD